MNQEYKPRRAFVEPVNGVNQFEQPQPFQGDAPLIPPYDFDNGGAVSWSQQHPYPQPVVINNVDAGPRTNHLLHLTLTVLTLGFWGPVWLIIWLVRGCR